MSNEDKALKELLEDIEMDDFHYAIKYGEQREIREFKEFQQTKNSFW